VTGKASGSAGVCTTDTCLDSITDSEPLFSSDKNGKKLSPPPRKSSLPLRSAVSVTARSRSIEAAPFAVLAVTVILSAGSSRYVCKVRKHVRGLRECIPLLRSRISRPYFFRCSLCHPVLPPPRVQSAIGARTECRGTSRRNVSAFSYRDDKCMTARCRSDTIRRAGEEVGCFASK